MIFSAIYLDGKSSKEIEVKVEIVGNLIKFTSFSTLFDRKTNAWDIRKTKRLDFSTSKELVLKYGEDYPYEILKIEDLKAIERIKTIHVGLEKNIYQQVLNASPLKIIGLSMLSVALFLGSYFYIMAPFFANRIVDLVPISMEVEIGENMSKTFLNYYVVNENKTELLQEFYKEAGFESDYPVEISYIDEDMVNAFAAPGGKIIVFEGIIDAIKSPEELAGLMAHELAHVNQRHTLKTLSRQVSHYGVISAITSDISGIVAIFADAAVELNSLENSRSFETEADFEAYKTLVDLNINPMGLVDLFHTLDEESHLLNIDWDYLSTHPNSIKRADKIQDLIDVSKKYNQNQKLKELFTALKQ